MSNSSSTLGNLLAELREQTTSFRTRCKTAGWFGALFHVAIQQDVLADVSAAQVKTRDGVFTEEQAAITLERKLSNILADGSVTTDELPELREIQSTLRVRSEKLHSLTEQLA
jgi:hypothetical protein